MRRHWETLEDTRRHEESSGDMRRHETLGDMRRDEKSLGSPEERLGVLRRRRHEETS